jgi:hypothetical protein
MGRSKRQADTERIKVHTRHAAERIRVLIFSTRDASNSKDTATQKPFLRAAFRSYLSRHKGVIVLQKGREPDFRCRCMPVVQQC